MKKSNLKTIILIITLMINLLALLSFICNKMDLTFAIGITLVCNIIRDIIYGDFIKIDKE